MKTGFDLEKMRAGLQAAGLDAGVVTSLPNVRYCTGIEIQTHACLPLRLQMLVIPVSGSPLLLGCETKETLASQAPEWLDDIRCYREFDKGPMDVLADAIAEMGLTHARLGIEPDWLVVRFWSKLRELCPDASFENVGPILDVLRAIKTPAEVDALRDAYLKTVATIRDAFRATGIGDTETDVSARLRRGLIDRGATNIDFNVVVIEERTPWAHPPATERKLGPGEILRVDVGAAFGLYTSDVGRTASVGHWRPEIREAFDNLAGIREEVIPKLQVGTPIGEIHSRIMGLYPKFGLPTPPIHTLLIGHSLGVEVHEPPIISPDTTTPLTPGMVLNIEPDVRPDGLCLAHECTYLVSDSGIGPIAVPDEDAPLTIDPQ